MDNVRAMLQSLQHCEPRRLPACLSVCMSVCLFVRLSLTDSRLEYNDVPKFELIFPRAGVTSVPIFSCRGQTSGLGLSYNYRFGVALAMRHRLSRLSTYGLNGQCLGD